MVIRVIRIIRDIGPRRKKRQRFNPNRIIRVIRVIRAIRDIVRYIICTRRKTLRCCFTTKSVLLRVKTGVVIWVVWMARRDVVEAVLFIDYSHRESVCV